MVSEPDLTPLTDPYPLLNLRLVTARLELRLPSTQELFQLGRLAAEGIHEPGRSPFDVPWSEQPPTEVAKSTVQFHWGRRGGSTPQNWYVPFTVFQDGVVVGSQDLRARDFNVLREVSTGSWLGRRFQGQGIGTEMRAAVLHLAFAGLGAQFANSGAFIDNQPSLGVSRKLGYQLNGVTRRLSRGKPRVTKQLRLSRPDWEAHRAVSVEIIGLEPCLADLGLSGAPTTRAGAPGSAGVPEAN